MGERAEEDFDVRLSHEIKSVSLKNETVGCRLACVLVKLGLAGSLSMFFFIDKNYLLLPGKFLSEIFSALFDLNDKTIFPILLTHLEPLCK